ncbi:uncharacterized protein [Dermacentor albipictus]|uniref:uncharacterized protein isoform X4 n=1 Tax=Dermacentor albipictus TaxID=60249 RepID=UPI0038FD3C6F
MWRHWAPSWQPPGTKICSDECCCHGVVWICLAFPTTQNHFEVVSPLSRPIFFTRACCMASKHIVRKAACCDKCWVSTYREKWEWTSCKKIGHQLQRRCLGCPWEAVQGCNQWRPRGTSVAYARMHRSGEATWCCTSGCTQASVRFGATCAAAHLQATQTWCDTCARTPVSDPFSARCARPLSHSAATPVPTTSVCMAGQHQWHEATGLPALPLTARTIDTTVTPIGHRLQQRCLGHPWEPVQGCNQWGPRGTSVAYARMHRSGEATWCCTSGCTQASVRFGATCAAARLQAAQTWCATSARTLASDRFSARCARPLSPGVATSVFTSACMTCRQQRLNATGFPALPLTARGIDTAVTPASAFTRLSLFGRS